MRSSRLFNLALKHSLFATGTAIAYTLYEEVNRENMSRATTFFSTEDDSSSTRNKNHGRFEHDKVIINAAFREVGWKQPVYVAYDQQHTGVFLAMNPDLVRSAYVLINSQHFANADTYDADLYSAMGHEAIHAIHNDQVKESILKGYMLYVATYLGVLGIIKSKLYIPLSLPLLAFENLSVPGGILLLLSGIPQDLLSLVTYSVSGMLLNAAYTASLPLIRFHEVRADKESARLLGTASLHANFLERYAQQNIHHSFFDEHPNPAKRVANLRKLQSQLAHQPRFFESPTYLELKQRALKQDLPAVVIEAVDDEHFDNGCHLEA